MKLIPCPFCKSADVHYLEEENHPLYHFDGLVVCNGCEIEVKCTPEQWDIRATDPVVDQMKEELIRLNRELDEARFAALADNSVPRLVFHAAIDSIVNKDELLKEMAEALEKLSRLGNEPYLGNSVGNVIAQDALQKYHEQVGDTNAK